MATTINADDGVISGSAGLKSTPDASGALAFQNNGVTAANIAATGQLTLTIANMVSANPSAFTVTSTAKAAQTGSVTAIISTANTDATYAGSLIRHFYANQGTFTVVPTTQQGYYYNSGNTGATNNYAFVSDMTSGTGRWNLYMSGTAANYIAGGLQIGGTADSTATSGLTLGTANMPTPGGSAPLYLGRAWVNMDTTTATITVRESGNISSITDSGVGRFTLNFTNAMPDANYVMSGSSGNATGTTTASRSVTRDGTWTTTACQVRNLASSTTSDDSYVGILILR